MFWLLAVESLDANVRGLYYNCLIDTNLSNSDDIHDCDWLEHLIINPESAMKALSAGCRTFSRLVDTKSKTSMYFENE